MQGWRLKSWAHGEPTTTLENAGHVTGRAGIGANEVIALFAQHRVEKLPLIDDAGLRCQLHVQPLSD